jgi:uncharacterized protein (DUF1330 family)
LSGAGEGALVAETVRVVSLWIHLGQEAAFAAFEREAAAIMASHGGRIDRANRTREASSESPCAVHIVVFPDDSAFEAYRSDPRILQLAQRRSGIIAKTIALDGQFAGPY